MGKSLDNLSGALSAWSIAVLQNTNELPEGGIEVLENYSKAIIEDLEEKGGWPNIIDIHLEIYDIPEIIYKLAEDDEYLKELNSKIKALSPEFQKLLHFIIEDYDVDNICQTMGYSQQHVYWKKKEECIQLISEGGKDLSDELKEKLKKVYGKYTSLRDAYLNLTDVISEQNKKKKVRRKWLVTSLTALVIPLIFFFFIYPRLIQKDYKDLFSYAVELSGFEMTMDSTELMDEMILEAELYSPESYWLLALKSLQLGDGEECKEQLKSLRASDKDLFIQKGRYIYKRLKY